jgi:hypothetical protein
MRRLLLLLLVVTYSGFANAEIDLDNGKKPADLTAPEMSMSASPFKKWYVGGVFGLATMPAFETKPIYDYYASKGYYWDGSSSPLFMEEGKIYLGYRLLEFMDVEGGITTGSTNMALTVSNSAGDHIWSKRDINYTVLSMSALLRPEYGYGHVMFLRLGAHRSQMEIKRTVTGNPANLEVIAIGDHIPEDGTTTDMGTIVGFGFDFRTAKVGAIRLEVNRLNGLGGTKYRKEALNLGYQVNF